MEKGISFETKYIEKSLSDETKIEIDLITKESQKYEIKETDFLNEINILKEQTTENERISLRNYTGYNFKRINAILRNNWNYEEHGKKDDDIVKTLTEDISIIDSLIERIPKNSNAFMTYRGTEINSFKKYGITSLEELKYLKGKFLYEPGYTSTSLSEDDSYFNKEILGKYMNIEIKYIIPPYSQDGIPLLTDDLSYSKNQQEYLIDRSSLSKVLDVEINDKTAIITAVLIPKTIWNKKEINKDDYKKK